MTDFLVKMRAAGEVIPWIVDSDYADLEAAVAASVGHTLIITQEHVLTGDMSFPATMAVIMFPGSKITLATETAGVVTTYTLTIACAFNADRAFIFDNSIGGTVLFNYPLDGFYPGWFYSETDLSSTLQSLLNLAGLVKLLDGTCCINSGVTLSDNTSLVGEGTSTIIKCTGTALTTGVSSSVSATDKSNITISDLAIDGNKAGGSEFSHCLAFNGCSNVTVTRTYLHDSQGDCILLFRGTINKFCSNVMIYNNVLEDPYRCNVAVVGGKGIRITDNVITKTDSTYVAAIDIEVSNTITEYNQDIVIAENSWNVPDNIAINIFNPDNILMTLHTRDISVLDNFVLNCEYFLRLRNEVKNVNAIGNTVVNADTYAFTGYCTDDVTMRQSDITVKDNKIFVQGGASGSGFTDIDRLSISGNSFVRSASGSTIAFYVDNSTYVDISNNLADGYSNTAGAFYVKNVDYCKIDGNIVKGANYGIGIVSTGAADGSNNVAFSDNLVYATGRGINIGQLDAHTYIQCKGNSIFAPRDIVGWHPSTVTGYESDVVCLDRGYTTVSSSGTGEDTLETTTIMQYSMDASHSIVVQAAGRKENANGNKTIKLYFGATAITVFPAANDVVNWQLDATIMMNNSTSLQIIFWTFNNNGTVTMGRSTAAEDNSAGNSVLKLTGECAHASDLIHQDIWVVERF